MRNFLVMMALVLASIFVVGNVQNAYANDGSFSGVEWSDISNGDSLNNVVTNCNCSGHTVAQAHVCTDPGVPCDDYMAKDYDANFNQVDRNKHIDDIVVVFKYDDTGTWRTREKSKSSNGLTEDVQWWNNNYVGNHFSNPPSLWVSGDQWDPAVICGGCGGG